MARKKWYFIRFQLPNQPPDTDTIDAPDMEKARLWFMDNRHRDTNIISIQYINL
jgi:hypothetical protein